MIITDLKWLKKIVDLSMFPYLQDNSNDFSVVDQLSKVTFSRIAPLNLF